MTSQPALQPGLLTTPPLLASSPRLLRDTSRRSLIFGTRCGSSVVHRGNERGGGVSGVGTISDYRLRFGKLVRIDGLFPLCDPIPSFLYLTPNCCNKEERQQASRTIPKEKSFYQIRGTKVCELNMVILHQLKKGEKAHLR